MRGKSNFAGLRRATHPLAVAGLLGMLGGCAYPAYPGYGYAAAPAYAGYPAGYDSGYGYGYVPSGAYVGYGGGWGWRGGGGWDHDDWRRRDPQVGGWNGHQTTVGHPGSWSSGHSNPAPAVDVSHFNHAPRSGGGGNGADHGNGEGGK